MKTNLQSVRFIALLVAISATFVTQTVHAQTDTFRIGLTEVSSTELDFTGDVSSVQNTSPDQWTIFLSNPNAFAFVGADGSVWVEPESSTTGNVLTSAEGELFVTSDMITALSKNADGSTVGFAGEVDNGIGGLPTPAHFDITFTDNAATAETPVSTPDTGSTLGLLSLALAALFGASRLQSVRLA